jgi:hypothetical protein
MKLYPLLVLSLISALGNAQDIGFGPSLTLMHYPSLNLQTKSSGLQLLFPALFVDSNAYTIIINSSLNEFDPGIQNHAIGMFGSYKRSKLKLGLAQFGNKDYKIQSWQTGIQLKLTDKLYMGTEMHWAQSLLSNYKNLYLMGTALGICIQLHPSLTYINKIGFFGTRDKENNWAIRHEHLHLLSLQTKEILTLNLAMMKYLEQNESLFSFGYLLQLKPQFSVGMTYQTGTKSIAVGLNLHLTQLQFNIETKYNQALGMDYLIGLSKQFHTTKKKQ